MDHGKGNFIRYSDYTDAVKAKKNHPEFGGIFCKNEIVEIKGSRFRISQILPKGLKLALLPKDHE